MTTLQIADLTREPELQCRAKGTQRRTVEEYADAMKAGAAFPPIVVYRDGKGVCWLADGFHRCAAALAAGLTEIAADVREGSRKDALLYAAKANGEHGLRRTNADKRAAVLRLLTAFPKMKDREIGRACSVDHKTVGKLRRPTEPAGEIPSEHEGAESTPTPPDLESLYAGVLAAHQALGADAHRRAFDDAVALVFAPPAEAAADPAPVKRRRVVEPKGDAVLAAGGE